MPIGESHRHEETMLASPERPGRGRRIRWLLGALAVAVGLPALLLLTAALLLPPEAIARAAAQRARAALGVAVSISGVGMDLWPIPSVALTDVRLGPEDDALAHVERVLLRPRILPLFSGNVQVREIAIDRPTIRLAVDTAGALNHPFSKGGNGENGAGSNIDFAVDEFRIRGGRLSYSDARDGTHLQVQGLEQTLRIRGRIAAGSLARVDLDGAFSAESIDAALPARLAAPVRGIRLSVDHSAELDREADLLELRSIRLEVQRVALEGRGRIEAASDSLRRTLSLDLRTDPFSFDDLARSLPEGFLAALLAGRDAEPAPAAGAEESETEYAGRAEIDLRISGLLTRDSIPQLQGEVRLSEVAARRRGSSLLGGTGGAVAFSNAGVEGREIAGRFFGEPFGLSFRVVNLAAPVVSFVTRGTARAEELVGLLEMGDSVRAAGRIPFDLQGTFQPDDPARATVEGTVGLGGVEFSLPSLLQAIRIDSGQLRFVGTELRMEDMAATFGESP